MVAHAKPSGGSRALRGLAGGMDQLLRDAGHPRTGEAVRVRGDDSGRQWFVAGVGCDLVGTGAVVSYRLQSLSERTLVEIVLASELVERADVPPAPPEAPAGTPAPPTGPVPGLDTVRQVAEATREAVRASEPTGAPERIVWEAVGPNEIRSADGRFVIATDGGWRSATDTWTGERVAKLATESAAQQWCRVRTDAPPLEWHDFGAAHVARSADGAGFAVLTVLGRVVLFYGVDGRVAEAGSMRVSPLFATAAGAQRWCEVRACCVLEAPAAPGRPPALRYVSPIPF